MIRWTKMSRIDGSGKEFTVARSRRGGWVREAEYESEIGYANEERVLDIAKCLPNCKLLAVRALIDGEPSDELWVEPTGNIGSIDVDRLWLELPRRPVRIRVMAEGSEWR